MCEELYQHIVFRKKEEVTLLWGNVQEVREMYPQSAIFLASTYWIPNCLISRKAVINIH